MTVWIIVVILFVLLCLPVCADVKYDGEFTVSIRYLFLRFKVFPSRTAGAEKKEKGAGKAKDNGKKEKSDEKNSLSEKIEKLKKTIESVKELLSAAKGPVKLLLKSITLFRLEMTVAVAGDDAAATGERYGRISALVYPLLEQLRRIKRPLREKISIYPDFINLNEHIYAYAIIGITPITVIAAVVKFAFNYIKIIIKNNVGKTMSKAESHK